MKTQMGWIATAALTLALVAPSWSALAQEAERSGMQHGMMSGDMAMECQSMMAERQQMMSRMKQNQETLGALVETMHRTTGEAKVEAIDDVVSALVSQRAQMIEHMAETQPRMMAHMMRHMQMSMSQGGGDPAGSCPMMKGMMSKPGGDSESRR